MSELFFVFKTLIITVVVVLLMQMKIGSNTIEQHSLAWIRSSSITEILRDVADGAIVVGTKAYLSARELIGAKMGSDEKSSSDESKAPRRRAKDSRVSELDGPMGEEID